MQRESKIYHSFFIELLAKCLVQLAFFYITGVFTRALNAEAFGIWSLLHQAVFFISLADFGLAGGAIRNKFAALQENKKEKMLYFNALFFLILACYGTFICFFLGIGEVFKWNFLIPVDWSVLFSSCLLFIALRGSFSLYHTVLYAEGKNRIKSFLEAFSFVLLMLAVTFLRSFKQMILGYFILFFFLEAFCFSFFMKMEKLSFQKVSFKKIKSIFFELAAKSLFFWIQNLVSLVLFSSSPYLITHFFGLQEAGEYFLYSRPFLLILGLSFLFLNSLWSGISDAFFKKDGNWIKQRLKIGFFQMEGVIVTICLLFFFFYQPLFFYWTGKRLENMQIIASLCLWTIIYSSINYFSTFLNARGMIKRQVLFLVIGLFIHFFLSPVLGKKFGINGIIYSNIFGMIPLLISNILESQAMLKSLSLDEDFNC